MPDGAVQVRLGDKDHRVRDPAEIFLQLNKAPPRQGASVMKIVNAMEGMDDGRRMGAAGR